MFVKKRERLNLDIYCDQIFNNVLLQAALDVVLYGANFEGMKLAGMILIAVGFFLVMFPDNWPDYITRLLR
jgi:solute carrier family 35 protein F3/4